MSRIKPFGAALAVAAALVAPPLFAQPAAADTPSATPAGTTYVLPSAWTATVQGPLVLLSPPEPDSHMVLLDVDAKSAKDADAAMATAWAAYKTGATRPLKLATPLAPQNGWEERRRYDYETSPNERATVFGVAYRAGTQWLALIIESSDMTFEKRGSQFSLAANSLRPKGYRRESFAGKKAHPIDAKMIAALTKFLEDGMKKVEAAGVAFSLIDGGKVVYEGGLGVKSVGKPEKVDANTLFIAASNTKAMTTLLLAELVDEKKLRWDEPVTEAYPAFKLGDAATTKQVLVKHLICACTGMPRQDLEWLFEYRNSTPASSLALLGTMQPTSKFGELFQYSNLMAAAAGYVGASLAVPGKELGAAYDDAMRTKVFIPLGMTSTTFDFARALKGNVALPNGEDIDGKPSRGHMDLNESVIPVRPAGGVWTSAHDLSRYVMMELAKGRLPDGKRLVSEENLLARRAPQVIVSEDITYGMGLTVDKRWGVSVVHHGGDLVGYHSDMFWFPEYGAGGVILSNSDSGVLLRGPFLRKILELMFDGRPEADAQLAAAAANRKAGIAKERERLVVPADAAEAAKLAPHYVSDGNALGDVTIRKDGSAVVFDVGEWKSPVASRKNDDGSISFITIEPTLAGFEFVVADRDGKRALVVRDGQHEYVFRETPAK
jgi:CubicO group peptidase (beta-lactamase class C family)